MKLAHAVLRLAPVAAVFGLIAGGCAATSEPFEDDEDMYPDIGVSKGGLASCGTPLVSWNGTTAYSNGQSTGTGSSCAGSGSYGLQYQCVELVMRHFKTTWGLRWYGNAKDLLNNAPVATVDVYKNGDAAHPPVPGDMIVFGGGPYGHVALVTEVTDTSVKIIEQNVPSSFTRTLSRSGGNVSAGWSGWWTMGWAHAKANTTPGTGGAVEEPTTWSCSASAYAGQQLWTCEDGDLHRCENGQPVTTDCGDAGCNVNPVGTDDTCKSAAPPEPEQPPSSSWDCADSEYLGKQYWTCDGDARSRCDSGSPQTEACSMGCWSMNVGQDDLCIAQTSGWSCSASSYVGKQYWTCSGGKLYRCSGETQQMVACPSGCNVNKVGTDDSCK